MKRIDVIVIVAVVAVMLVGMVLSYGPNIYRCDLDAWNDEDGIHYTYSSNYGMETHTTLIESSAGYDFDTILVYFDTEYAAMNDWGLQETMLIGLGEQLGIRSGPELVFCDSQELAESLPDADRSSVAVLIAAGAVSDVLYDGTSSCILLEWLMSGGTVMNMSGCLGKYVSHGPDSGDIEQIQGYAELFTGIEGMDDSSFNDVRYTLRTDYSQNDLVQDSLGIQFNEYSYGIRYEGIGEYFSVGNESSDGYACALIYRAYDGMVMNFGMTVEYQSHTVHFVAQTIASGLDYTSTIVDYQQGHTYDSPSGVFDFSGGNLRIYGYVGSARAVYGECIILRSLRFRYAGQSAIQYDVPPERGQGIEDTVEDDEHVRETDQGEDGRQEHHVREHEGVEVHDSLEQPAVPHVASLHGGAPAVAVDAPIGIHLVVGVPQVHDDDHGYASQESEYDVPHGVEGYAEELGPADVVGPVSDAEHEQGVGRPVVHEVLERAALGLHVLVAGYVPVGVVEGI